MTEPRSGAMIRLIFPLFPMQKAAIAWPRRRASGMSSSSRRQSAAVPAWVTILTIAGRVRHARRQLRLQEFRGRRSGEVVPGDDQPRRAAGERGDELCLQGGIGGRFDIHIIGAQAHRLREERHPFLFRPGESSALLTASVRDDHRGAPGGEEPLQVGVRHPVDPELDEIGERRGALHLLDGLRGPCGGDGDADHGSSSPRG